VLTDAQRDELDRRINSYYASLDLGASWSEVKERIQASK